MKEISVVNLQQHSSDLSSQIRIHPGDEWEESLTQHLLLLLWRSSSQHGGSQWFLSRNLDSLLRHGSSHNSLADGVDEAVLVEVLREAFQGKRAKALGGLDGVSKGRSEGSSREARVDMGGGSREADGEERGQDLEYWVIFWIILS